MKYLKTYSQIFESSKTLDLIDEFLSGMVDFPEIYKDNIEAWLGIIDGIGWKHYIETTDIGYENELSVSREEYEKCADIWEDLPLAKKNFDYFMASIHGFGDWYHEGDIESQIQDKPIEWYEQEFEKPLFICKMMKALADEDTSLLDPEFTQM